MVASTDYLSLLSPLSILSKLSALSMLSALSLLSSLLAHLAPLPSGPIGPRRVMIPEGPLQRISAPAVAQNTKTDNICTKHQQFYSTEGLQDDVAYQKFHNSYVEYWRQIIMQSRLHPSLYRLIDMTFDGNQENTLIFIQNTNRGT